MKQNDYIPRLFLALLFCTSFHTLTVGQTVQNVKAVQENEKVHITYDLNDPSGKPYFVKLLMSKDGGTTFGDELKYVSGDVKSTQPGRGKKIIWDAEQEVSSYNGDAVFRVEATVYEVTLPAPVEKRCAKVELTSVKGEGNKIVVDMIITSQADCTSGIDRRKEYTSLVDTSGNQYQATSGLLGEAQLDVDKKMLKDAPVKSRLVFDNLSSELSTIGVLRIGIYSFGGCTAGYSDPEKIFSFINVPVSK
jgi:hypothetical protein